MSDDNQAAGVTRTVHVQQLLTNADAAIARVRKAIHPARRLTAVERGLLSRELAGVVGICETVRIWLGAGAPR